MHCTAPHCTAPHCCTAALQRTAALLHCSAAACTAPHCCGVAQFRTAALVDPQPTRQPRRCFTHSCQYRQQWQREKDRCTAVTVPESRCAEAGSLPTDVGPLSACNSASCNKAQTTRKQAAVKSGLPSEAPCPLLSARHDCIGISVAVHSDPNGARGLRGGHAAPRHGFSASTQRRKRPRPRSPRPSAPAEAAGSGARPPAPPRSEFRGKRRPPRCAGRGRSLPVRRGPGVGLNAGRP